MTANARDVLVVFGATGRTGTHVVRTALEDGMAVRAVVRSPARLAEDLRRDTRLEVAEADVADPAAVDRAVAGGAMVFAAIGYKGTGHGPLLVPFVTGLLASMRAHGVRRLVHQASGLNAPHASASAMPVRLLRPLLGRMLSTSALWDEHDAVIRLLLEEASDLDWTVTRPGRLKDSDSKGTLLASSKSGGALACCDVAAFSLDAVRSGAHARTWPHLRYADR